MKEVTANNELVAYCGLYCGACGAYLKGRCQGCHENVKAKWCKVRACCLENSYLTCAACDEFEDPNDCRKFNNFFSKMIGFFFNSNRRVCVLKIRELGVDGFAVHMAKLKKQSFPRKG
ncbi:MAG: DUF3795 domain-containing protein [Pseudomonadota bacterium]